MAVGFRRCPQSSFYQSEEEKGSPATDSKLRTGILVETQRGAEVGREGSLGRCLLKSSQRNSDTFSGLGTVAECLGHSRCSINIH